MLNDSEEYVYVFYKGDNLQFVGTADECAQHFNTDKRSISWYASPTALRSANNGVDNRRLYAEKVVIREDNNEHHEDDSRAIQQTKSGAPSQAGVALSA